MCTSTRVWYGCGHEATKPFRAAVCLLPCTPACEVRFRILRLPWHCPRCLWGVHENTPGMNRSTILPMDYQEGSGPAFSETFWHIPTRCFIDPGFVTLDPFAADRVKQQIEAEEKRLIARHGHHRADAIRSFFHGLKSKGRRPKCLGIPTPKLTGACCERRRMFGMDNHTSKNRLFDDRCISTF